MSEFVQKNFTYTQSGQKRIEEILREASPFLSDLSINLFLEMLFCEAKLNPDFETRAKAFSKVALPDGKKSSLRLNTAVDAWIQGIYGFSSNGNLTTLIEWIAADWPWIKKHLTYKGVTR